MRCTRRVDPTGIVDLFTTTLPGTEHRRDLAGDRLDEREVGRAVVALGGRDAEEHELGGRRRGRRADHEAQAAGVEALGDELGEAVLHDRDLALREPVDPVLVDVGADDGVAEVREARAGGEPDVAGADDRDAAHACSLPGSARYSASASR